MSVFAAMKPGQWVLSFHQPYGPFDRTMPELLESYAFLHWMDVRDKDEMFFVLQVQKVMANTFLALGSNRFVRVGERLPRTHVIASFPSEADAITLRDTLFAIGVETGDAIEKEMYRRIEKFADRMREAAARKIHRLLPQHFRSDS